MWSEQRSDTCTAVTVSTPSETAFYHTLGSYN